MKNTNNYIFNWLLIIAFTISITIGCTNSEWDSHYNQSDSKLDTNILQLLAEDENRSDFLDLVEKTGYTSVLEGSRTHTVWAPSNVALALVTDEIKNDSLLLKAFVENHISLNSYNSTSIDTTILVNMFNNKFIQFTNTDGDISFGGIDIVENDLDFLTNNGIVHKVNEVLSVKPSIWTYLNENEDQFPTLLSYLNQFKIDVFDEENSVRIGFNDSGETVYDSVYRASNSLFETIGNIDLESERSTFIGLKDEVYNDIYDDLKGFYKHTEEDTTLRVTNKAIFENLNFREVSTSSLDGSTPIISTGLSELTLNSSLIDEDILLSNGNILVVNDLNYEPKDIVYKNIRYEIENPGRRTIRDPSIISVVPVLDRFSSGFFTNIVTYNETNRFNYFEIQFSNVLSAKYNLNIKFSNIELTKGTKLDFNLYYNNPFTNKIEQNPTGDFILNNTEEGVVTIGDIIEIPSYVNDNPDNPNPITLRISIDVSEAEQILYARQFGIDYVELTPVVEEELEE